MTVFLTGIAETEINTTGNTLSGENGITGDYQSNLELRPDRVVRAGQDIYYGLSREAGLLFSADSGISWEPRNDGLPTKLIYPFRQQKVRYLTALGVDQVNPSRVLVSTTNSIYLSEDFGITWRRIETKNSIPHSAYITSLALSPKDNQTILIGTSFSGMFETGDLGKSWVNISDNLKFLYQGAGFWDEISALAYDRDDPDQIYFVCGFSNSFYKLAKERKNAIELSLPSFSSDGIVEKLQETNIPEELLDPRNNNPLVPQPTANPQLVLDTGTLDQLFKNESYRNQSVEDLAKLERLKTAADKYGIYVRADYVHGKYLDKKFEFIKNNGFNAMVIDFKDDFGRLTYNTKLEIAYQVGSAKQGPVINVEELLAKAKENGIYVIARIVVFQDPKLYHYQNFKYAAWDRITNKPWGTKEYWVDPFAKDVWDYDLAIAEELQSMGIDEIQFDYIRFPTDGAIGRIVYRYQPDGSEKIDALESFLAYARERLYVPVSTDLYGFNCWCRVDSVNGQNIELIANYVDVICPMYYPSHFPGRFMPGTAYLDRAKKIYYDGTNRAYSIVKGRSLVRPYVQAFLLGGERKMTKPVYSKYLYNQIEGVLESSSPSFTLWNFSNDYYMVTKPLLYLPNSTILGIGE